MLWYGYIPRIEAIVVVPSLILILILTTLGLALWLSALAVQYRDVSHGLAFAIQALMYVSPVVYSDHIVPERFRLIYGLNPVAGVIGGMRAVVLGTGPLPMDLILPGATVALAPRRFWSLLLPQPRTHLCRRGLSSHPPILQPSRRPQCPTR